jgi:hypothetical protein
MGRPSSGETGSSCSPGRYYAATGAAPFVSRRAFERSRAQGTKWWLVQTLGVLVTVIGGVLLGSAVASPESTALATSRRSGPKGPRAATRSELCQRVSMYPGRPIARPAREDEVAKAGAIGTEGRRVGVLREQVGELRDVDR